MREVTVNISVMGIRRVLFSPSYAALISKSKCDHYFILARDRCAMQEVEHMSERLGLAR